MRITADTNILVRALVLDNPPQAKAATNALRRASHVAVSISCLCELVWVLRTVYKFKAAEVLTSIKTLLASPAVLTDRRMAEAGILFMEAGGDFADGVIAYDGLRLGGETFVSFDRKAVALLKAQGQAATFLV